MNRRLISALILLLLYGTYWNNSIAEERVAIHYNERPPYLVTVVEGIVVGLTATPATKAFQSAGIPHYWIKTPSKRQMSILQANQGKDCLVGWFKNAHRQSFAIYSKAIYHDKPTVALALFKNKKITSGLTLADTFKNKNLTLLVKSGYSYGSYLDDRINRLNPKRHSVVFENTEMLRMLNSARVDYFFAAQEEADGLIKNAGHYKRDYKYIHFSDMPAGNKRYILCSKKVTGQTVDSLNVWIVAESN